MKAYVLFSSSEIWWVRLLTSIGFGHCDVVIEDVESYELYRFRRRGLLVTTYDKQSDEFKRIIACNRLVAVNECLLGKRKRSFLGFRFFSCVTMCKYMLGLESRAQTPWGLYSFLVEHHNDSNSNQ